MMHSAAAPCPDSQRHRAQTHTHAAHPLTRRITRVHWHSKTYICIRSLAHAHRHHCQAASTFPIKPDDLIDRCKEVILAQAGIQDGSIDESIYADDFRFCAPFVGGPTNANPDDPLPGLTKVRVRARARVRARVRVRVMTAECVQWEP